MIAIVVNINWFVEFVMCVSPRVVVGADSLLERKFVSGPPPPFGVLSSGSLESVFAGSSMNELFAGILVVPPMHVLSFMSVLYIVCFFLVGGGTFAVVARASLFSHPRINPVMRRSLVTCSSPDATLSLVFLFECHSFRVHSFLCSICSVACLRLNAVVSYQRLTKAYWLTLTLLILFLPSNARLEYLKDANLFAADVRKEHDVQKRQAFKEELLANREKAGGGSDLGLW